MRKVILNLCTSLDSFIEGEKGEIDWCFTDQDYSMTDFLNRVDTIFYGRKSYELQQQLMPQGFPGKKDIVFSTTLKNISKDSTIINGNIAEEVKKIQQQSGKDIWLFGGANLTSTFLGLKLVDELIISIHPLLLGKGKPLFADISDRITLKLTDTKTFSTGLVQLYYKVEKD